MCSENDILMLSAMQHILFCERQCALIHIEQQWEENIFTVEGNIMHEKVHDSGNESRGNIKIARGVPLRSLMLGISGIADVVEYHKNIDAGEWIPYPVEYKRGKPKEHRADEVQLCAQAICLEEMQKIKISCGALFYGKTRRKMEVIFDNELRNLTINTAEKLHLLIKNRKTPPAKYEKKCKACSLFNICMPQLSDKKYSAEKYMTKMLEKI
jgi:CRISPR-associated exonuclease Cas4